MLKETELRPIIEAETARRPEPDVTQTEPAVGSRGRPGLILIVLLVVGVAAFLVYKNFRQQKSPAGVTNGKQAIGPGRGPAMPVPVTPGMVATRDVPIFLDGLGTVQAFNTVTVRSRVDGELQRVNFLEGQDVKAGDLLAQIDAAPFQAQLDQAVAKKGEDEAQLGVARVTFKRNADLLASQILSRQDYDTQEALVKQLEATVAADQAAITNAAVQLSYTHILSPLDGRVGIRLMDQGNMVRATDSNGLVVITQLHPISVVFTLAEKFLPQIQQARGSSTSLTVIALDRNNTNQLGEGKLAVVDNQIDTTTGTIRLKATFLNEDLRLWPGQFVNARLLLSVRKGGVVVPAQVIQRGPDGAYAFVIKDDSTVEVRPVTVALVEQGQALIDKGLRPGERVVVDNQFKLQPGSKVKLPEAGGQGTGSSGPRRPSGNRGNGPA
jgi:multidrug efflux system membrane fusion protein